MEGAGGGGVEVVSREVVLASRPQGWPCQGDFEVRQQQLNLKPAAGSRDVHVKCLWASLDPYLRDLMNQAPVLHGIPVFQLHEPLWTLTISKVIASDNPDFHEGDLVCGHTNVADYAVVPGGSPLQKIEPAAEAIPLTYYLGVLGLPGHTAWVGLNKVAELKSNEEVYITAAAGAVGLLAGQLAKLKGCRVVGSAGSDEKVKLLKEVYSFDDAFNYKTEKDWNRTLTRLFPRGIDVYLDNVGGAMLDAVLLHMNVRGRIAACGMISQYNKRAEEADGVRNLFHIVGKSIRMEGFLAGMYLHTVKEFREEVTSLIQQGKIKYREDVLGCGVHEFPRAFVGMLQGQNVGKAVLQICTD